MKTDIREVLAASPLTVHGRIVNASNGTMLVEAEGGGEVLAVYKPQSGERPLWDFPFGTLHLREVAAFEISDYLGWEVVPTTILRDGPFGPGSVQLFIEHDPRQHYFVLVEDERHDQALLRMAAFDLVVNNADRKGGHVLLDPQGHIWGCDHGLTFHEQTKLRTVIWDFGGVRLAPQWIDDLRRLATDLRDPRSDLAGRLRELLSPREIAILGRRATALANAACLPDLDEDERPYPWPPI